MRNIWQYTYTYIYQTTCRGIELIQIKEKEKLLNKKIIFSDVANHPSLFSFTVIVNNSHTGSSDKIVKLKE